MNVISGTVGAATVTSTDIAVVPPGPAHVNVNVPVLVNDATTSVSLTAFVPLHSPDAVHDAEFDEDHVRVSDPSYTTEVVSELKVTVGGAEVTPTETVCAALPPAPVQLNVYAVFAVRLFSACMPEAAFVPVQALEVGDADAVQDVALVLLQFSVVEPLGATMVGLADRVTVGSGGAATFTMTDELTPPQANVYVADDVRLLSV